jgi:hypothetical protein
MAVWWMAAGLLCFIHSMAFLALQVYTDLSLYTLEDMNSTRHHEDHEFTSDRCIFAVMVTLVTRVEKGRRVENLGQ